MKINSQLGNPLATPSMKGLGTSDLTVSIAQAIYQMEGSGPTTIATRNHNPGNLRSGVGQIGTNGGYAVFATMTDGWNALYNQIDINISRGLTLYEFFGGKPGVYAGYAPSADSNDPTNYANFVASRTGIDPSVPLNSLGGGGTVVDPGTTAGTGTVDTTTAGLFGMDSTTLWIAGGVLVGLIVIGAVMSK